MILRSNIQSNIPPSHFGVVSFQVQSLDYSYGSKPLQGSVLMRMCIKTFPSQNLLKTQRIK